MADKRYGIPKRQHPHRLVIVVLIGGVHFLLELREDQGIPEMENEYAHKEPRDGRQEAAAIIGKRPVDAHYGDPERMSEKLRNCDGDLERVGDARPGPVSPV